MRGALELRSRRTRRFRRNQPRPKSFGNRNIINSTLQVILLLFTADTRVRRWYTGVHTFSYAGEDVAQINDLVARIVFGYGHRSPSPQLAQTQHAQTDALFERFVSFSVRYKLQMLTAFVLHYGTAGIRFAQLSTDKTSMMRLVIDQQIIVAK